MNLGEKTSKVMCYPMPNYIGSAAVSLTKLDYRGIFHDWMLKGLLVYRF